MTDKQANQYATIAENRIWDTRLDDLDARIDGDDLAPSISIYTGEGGLGIGGQNPNHIATYASTKLQIELTIFGGYAGFGTFNNSDRFLSLMISVFEQQIFDALFKAQNANAEAFRERVNFTGNWNSVTLDNSTTERKIIEQRIEMDIQLPEQYNSSPYPQDRIDIFDYYPEYVNLIPEDMRSELQKVLAVNDATKLETINTEFPIPVIQSEFIND